MKSGIPTVNWRKPAWISLALLCAFLIGCTGHTYRRPERTPGQGYVRYDAKKLIFEYYIPEGYLDDLDTKMQLVFISPRGKIIKESEWGATRRWGPRSHRNCYCGPLVVEDFKQLARKGGFGTWRVLLIVKKPGNPPVEVASDKFILFRRILRKR